MLGIMEAQGALGFLLFMGKYVERGKFMVARWYRLVAEQGRTGGSVEAQQDLGNLYYKGEGVAQSCREAYIWLSIADANGGKVSAKKLVTVAEKLGDAEKKLADDEVRRRLDKLQMKEDKRKEYELAHGLCRWNTD